MKDPARTYKKNCLRAYVLLAAVLLFLFFSNDFGLIDIQKTALILAVGVDREENEFIVTTQIAVPDKSEASSIEIESRGRTVADAFNQINIKTGWYPKLVFCDLIVLGKGTAERNVFDALDYFLRDEYMSDACRVVTTDVTAKNILDTRTEIDKISSAAIGKVLSDHAAETGSVLPVTLKDFAIGYFGAAESGWLPVVKIEDEEEAVGKIKGEPSDENANDGSGENSDQGSQGGQSNGGSQGGQGSQGSQGEEKKKIFSASETALFSGGIRTGTLDTEETFALSLATRKLKNASYSLESEGAGYTLRLVKTRGKINFSIDKNSMAKLEIAIKAVAAEADSVYAERLTEITNADDVSGKLLDSGAEKLKGTLERVFDKARKANCDVFGLAEKLQRYESEYYEAFKEEIFSRTRLGVSVSLSSNR